MEQLLFKYIIAKHIKRVNIYLLGKNNKKSGAMKMLTTVVETDENSDVVVEKIVKIINQQYSARLTTEDIAKQVNYSKKQVQRIFFKKTGKTIYKYLTEYRIERAKELLAAPNSKIYVSAEQVGYKNTLHFKKLFEKHTGMTPAEYKNEKGTIYG